MNLKCLIHLCFAFLVAMNASAQEASPNDRCAQSMTLVFSSPFRLCLPLSFVTDSKLARGDDLVVKRKDGSSFFGKVILSETADLPNTFDMRKYPEYLLGFSDLSELPAAIAGPFRRSKGLYATNTRFERITMGRFIVYLAKADGYSEAYVVEADGSQQVLMLGFGKIDETTIQILLQGLI